MIPVEKIASGTLNNLVLYVGIVGLLLVIAALIRLKVPILRKAFIPASLLAGLIVLVLVVEYISTRIRGKLARG